MRRVALSCLAGLLLLLAGPSRAQYLIYNAAQTGHPLPSARPSIRLDGMGDLELTIPDENNGINLLHYANILAGIAQDRDASSVDVFGTSSSQVDDYQEIYAGSSVRQHLRFRQDDASVEATYRDPGHRAIGMLTDWIGQTTNVSYGPQNKVRGPNIQGYYNQLSGPWSFAIGVTRWTDNESLLSPDIFGISHQSATWAGTFAAGLLYHGWNVGGQLELSHVEIDGTSSDANGFHDDVYTWLRPTTEISFAIIRPETNRLASGLDLDYGHIHGSELGQINWADRFPSNPSGLNFTTEVPTFEEHDDALTVQGRTSYRLLSNLRLGASAEYQHLKTSVFEDASTNFPGSQTAQDSHQYFARVGGGLGWELARSRLRLGAEGYVDQGKLTSVLSRSSSEVTSRSFELRTGGELLLPSHLAVRAGFLLGSFDADKDQPQNLYKSNGLTVGIGYLPRGGTISLDAAIRILSQKPNYSGEPDHTTDVQDLAVSARFLL